MPEKEWFRNYGIHYRDEPSKIMALEELIARVMSVRNKTRAKAITLIFEAGAAILREDPTYGTVEVLETAERARFFDRVREEAAKRHEFRGLYKELGAARMQELAQEAGVDLSGDLAEFTWPVSQFERMKIWILDHLSDGEPHSIESIRKAAIRDLVLPSPMNGEQFEADYKNFKVAASKLGVSGSHTKHGEWQKVKL